MSGIYPGALQALGDVEKLAAAEEWAVLAALAAFANRPEALGALAAASDQEAAFRWTWVVASSSGSPQHWQQVSQNLAEGLRVPEGLRDAVRDFVLQPVPQVQGGYQANQQQLLARQAPRMQAQVVLLSRLAPAEASSMELGRAVLEAEPERYWRALREAAFDSMGASGKTSREFVLERARELPSRERLRPLLSLSGRLSKAEQEEVYTALEGALPINGTLQPGGPNLDEYRKWAGALAAKLSEGRLLRLLGESWAQSEAGRAELFGGDFAALLSDQKVRKLLSSDLNEGTRRHLLRVFAEQLPLPKQADLGRWTHENLDPEWSQPLRNRLSRDARPPSRGTRSQQQEGALEALRDFALACDDLQTAADYAACLDPGEAPDLARRALVTSLPPERLGRVAGEILQRVEPTDRYPASPEGFRADVGAMFDLFETDTDRAAFLEGMVHLEGATGPDESALDLSFLGAQVLGCQQAMRVFAKAGYSYDLVPAAYEAQDSQEAFLEIAEAAVEHLGEDTLDTVILVCEWSKVDEARYGRLVAALRRRPDALLGEAASVLESLSGPDADAAPAGHVGIVLQAALDTAGGELTEAVPAYGDRLRDLLDQRDSGLRRLALRWALSLEPEEDILALLVAKQGSTHGLDEEFAKVLRSYARHLAGMSRDSALDSGERTRALKLAQVADQEEAREAAFEVAAIARGSELRLAAASVLSDTEAHPEDAEKLERLLSDEGDGAARRLLNAALRNISSGTVAGAIENLRSLVVLPSHPDRDPRVLLPDEVWTPVSWSALTPRGATAPATRVPTLMRLSSSPTSWSTWPWPSATTPTPATHPLAGGAPSRRRHSGTTVARGPIRER